MTLKDKLFLGSFIFICTGVVAALIFITIGAFEFHWTVGAFIIGVGVIIVGLVVLVSSFMIKGDGS